MSESPSLTSLSAGPSSFIPPPPPEAIQRDDYAAAEQARQRFSKRGLFSSVSLPLPNIHQKKSNSRGRDDLPLPSSIAELGRPTSVSEEGLDLVVLSDDPALLEEIDKDVYRWAILYENQRGATVFSTAYYSPLTLLPLDPPPFTIPTAAHSPRRNQPTVSLEDYPLPDGSWKWVSRTWMIDMHGDGQVQYDGFEYSRSFRSKKWGSNPGFMSNRGLVRRRRWIRLMVRPAQVHRGADSEVTAPDMVSTLPELEHNEEGATRPPSVILTVSDASERDLEVWKGDEGDWGRCHIALRRLGRDGIKLELWARWFGIPAAASRPASWTPVTNPIARTPLPVAERRSLQQTGETPTDDVASSSDCLSVTDKLTADTGLSTSKAPKDYVAAVIRAHGSDILSLFVYPDSRAKFLFLLGRVGLLPEIRAGLGASDSVQILDFWSYTRDLGVDAAHKS